MHYASIPAAVPQLNQMSVFGQNMQVFSETGGTAFPSSMIDEDVYQAE
jgi:hypothetical protein